MFNLSWAELFIIAIIALTCIGPKELPVVIKWLRSIIRKAQTILQELKETLLDDDIKKEAESINEDIKTIVDLEGKEQIAYDVSQLKDHSK